MAISYVRSATTSGTTPISLDIGSAGTKRLVVIIASDESSGTNLSGVTVDGKAASLVDPTNGVANNTDGLGNHTEMWYIDEDGLGPSSGVVSIVLTGEDGGWAAQAHLYTGVDQTGPSDTGKNQTSVSSATVSVSSIDAPANGLVVAGVCNGSGGRSASYTSPLVERAQADPASADGVGASGVEASAQTGKAYTTTWSGGTVFRSTMVVAVWAEDSAPTITDVETTEEFDDKQTGVTITGTTFGATKGTGKVELADGATYASANKIEQTTTSWGDTAIDFTADLGAQSPGTKYIFVTNDSAERSDGFAVTVHRAQAFRMSASANIVASGANTTAQLSAPSGKTTGDFDGGRIQDDENPADSVNITADDYTEMEWSIEAVTNAREVAYRFRVTDNGTALDTYTVNPQLTISAAGQTVNLGLASETASGFAIAGVKDAAVGLPSESDSALAVTAERSVAVGLSTSTESAQSLAISRSVAVGLAAEADSANALVLARSVDVGQASVSESGFAIDVSRSRDIGLADETESALAAAGDKQRAAGLAGDTEAAFVLGRAKLAPVEIGSEAESAFDIVPIRGLAVSTVNDTSAALAIAVLKQRAVGLATVSEQAFAATAQKGGAPPAANDDYLMRRRRRRAS